MIDESEGVLDRPAPGPDFTRAYGTDPNQLIDVHLPPESAAPRGFVVFVHGGYWRAKYDRVHARSAIAALIADGYLVASVEYRRVGQPGGGWPGTLEDALAGIAAAVELGAELGFDAAQPVVAGHSAGGHLALWASHRLGPDQIGGVLALAPVVGLDAMQRAGVGNGAMADLLRGGPDEVPERYREADPAVNLPIGVPVVVVHGSLDTVVPTEYGRAFVRAALASGDDVTLVELPDIQHFGLIDPLSSAWSDVSEGLASLTGRGRG